MYNENMLTNFVQPHPMEYVQSDLITRRRRSFWATKSPAVCTFSCGSIIANVDCFTNRISAYAAQASPSPLSPSSPPPQPPPPPSPPPPLPPPPPPPPLCNSNLLFTQLPIDRF
ncbi:hypothetical protein T4B_12109 [Trichinella pseudospiralis]|uniref:Uncharacterized protein n=1 Tax=Trichinella pseudospiralis TaxID=6337 RepID=A0A0V1J852_TRIPS|nr:hypothetical protein T4B_12109 [Trichinella pseudospiralis]